MTEDAELHDTHATPSHSVRMATMALRCSCGRHVRPFDFKVAAAHTLRLDCPECRRLLARIELKG